MSNILRNNPEVVPAVIATLKVKYKSARPWVIVTKIISFLMAS